MESAVDRGAVALHEIARLLGLVAPLRQYNVIEPPGQKARRGGRAEDDARARACRAGDLAPQFVELLVRHPVLRVQQDVAIERPVGPALEIFREGKIEDFDAIGPRADRFEMPLFQIWGQRAGWLVRIGTAERLPGEIIVVEAEAAGQ